MPDVKDGQAATSIDRIVDRVALWIERVLALALIAAVCLGFANVIGRYVVGQSILSAHEVQIYILIFMTFLGAAVVTWRKQHLRMDVLIDMLPETIRRVVRFAELVLFLVIVVFMLVLSTDYTLQMSMLGRVSDMAEIPMWIPHGAVAASFSLMALVLLWRGGVALVRRKTSHLSVRGD